MGALFAAAEAARGTWKSLGYKLPVLKLQAQAAGYKLQATSYKLQATSYKLQATSYKLQVLKWHAPGRA